MKRKMSVTLGFFSYLQNNQFSQSLQQKIVSLYQNSWVSLYFKCPVQEFHDGTVGFVDTHPIGTPIHQSPSRFNIDVLMPEKNRLYFLPQSHWTDMDTNSFYPVEKLSQRKHSMLVKGYNYTTSPYYDYPLTVRFKNNPPHIGSNYLICKYPLITTSFTQCLCLLSYNDDTDKFNVVFQPNNHFKYKNFLVLNNMLEFIIEDANQTTVEFLDGSVLILCITFI